MIRLDGIKELEAQLRRVAQVPARLPQMAARVGAETTAYMRIQADLSIYRTVQSAGGYERTGTLREGLRATVQAGPGLATVTATGSAPYTGYVEAGRGTNYAALQTIASQRTPQPYTLGRTGENWSEAAPMVTAGQAFAVFRLRQMFGEAVERAARGK